MMDSAQMTLSGNVMSIEKKGPATEETYPIIGLICLLGIFMHLFVSEPIMYLMGFHYSDEDNSFLEKQHFGTYVVLLSFILLLWRHRDPLGMLVSLYKSERVFTCFFAIYMLMLCYMIGRSGAKGISFLIDTQICGIVAALVLSRTPLSYCRNLVYIFIAFAVMNSLIGIGEGIVKERLFTLSATSDVQVERVFRACAWLGHPLNNAMFTSVMIFVTLGVRLPVITKTIVTVILSISLVAFNGRTGLLVSFFGLGVLGAVSLVRVWGQRSFTLFQTLMLAAGAILIPVACALGLYLLVTSSMGERLVAEGDFSDKSAETRVLVWRVFDYMKPEEFVFGMSPTRTSEIKERMSQSLEIYEIENPWIFMFMHLGLIVLTVWFGGMLAFIWRLMQRTPLALKIAVIGYFIIASSNNSFAVKGSLYLLSISVIICASRSLMIEDDKVPQTQAITAHP